MNSSTRRRTKVKSSSTTSTKDRVSINEPFIPTPSRQGYLNDQTDFTLDPSLIFDQLPQPFRRINKILESIFDDAWTIIEQREKQRLSEQAKFVSAQHTSSTIINTSIPISLIGSHISGTLCFFNGTQNEQSYLVCYDSQVDEIINQIPIDNSFKQMNVFKNEASVKNTIYFLSIIDKLGYWKMIAYKNQQYYLLFTQYETDDDTKRPTCLMTQTGLNDEYLAVSWFGTNNDSWVEIYKLSKEQWKSEITTQEQSIAASKNQTEENVVEQVVDSEPTLIRGQFSRPTLVFKAKVPKFSPGTNNIQQLMKNTENLSNIGQGTSNHFYTQQIIDLKTMLIRDLMLPAKKTDVNERPPTIPKAEPPPAITPHVLFIPAATATGVNSVAISWPTTNQLLIYKVAKPDNKGKESSDARPISIWPFSSHITSLTYDSKHEQLAVALESGNVCIIERTTGVNDLSSIQHISSVPTIDIHAIDSLERSTNTHNQKKQNGFFVLSQDGKIYRIKFKSVLTNENNDEQQNMIVCFPPEQSKDSSKITRMMFFNCNPSNLFLSINELNRIYINDALKCTQLCEITLSQSATDENNPIQIAFIDDARSIIIGVPDNESSSLCLYRVPLEHFPSLESYYPERKPPIVDEVEPIIETKPTKTTTSKSKPVVSVVVEIDKTTLLFDEKMKETFRKRQSDTFDRRERLCTRWNEIKLHFNPVYEQTT
ncbi:unnamed protein product [Adineta steineri]|uniref:Uncharacterized protein n=3 Tax=Adineta steineri TaxID=433720 RepID=A0A813MTT8_9BILA|nr:unnamed protein product [Adineta steineri]CAF0911755.1 unnamed protein product [Adineta steineri]